MTSQVELSPDGLRYLAAAQDRVPRPFHYRWLLPKLLKEDVFRWSRVTRGALFACVPLAFLYVGGGYRGLAAAGCVIGLSGVWHFNRRFPVLVDATGMAIALASAVCVQHGLWPLGIALALIGGCVRETSPVFAALYAWNPLALIGLLAPAVRHLQREGPDVLDAENRWILDHVVKSAIKYHKTDRVPLFAWVLPWGGALVALSNFSPQLAVTMIVAYAQCLVATDTVRLFMWCWPVVLLAAVHAVPIAWLPVLVALTIANPFATEGG